MKRHKPPVRITEQPGLTAALAKSASATFTNSIQRASSGRSFADLLSDLYAQADNLIADIASSGEPAIKRAEALKSVAKILPLLQAAERNAKTSIKGKAAEDMDAGELRELVKNILASEPVSPLGEGERAVNTKSLARTKKSDSKVASFPTSSLTDEELRQLVEDEADMETSDDTE